MKLGLGNKKYRVLTGDSQTTTLSEIFLDRSGSVGLHVLAATNAIITAEDTVNKLLDEAGVSGGSIAISLPLAFFELIAIDIPTIPDHAVTKTLPYHLAKVVSRPLNEFIYDWQITGRAKDWLQVTVYLFPAASFHRIRKELAKKQIQVTCLEPDVFSAFAWLEHDKRLPAQDAVACVLIWQDSISLAICHDNRITVVRSVNAEQPFSELTGSLAGQYLPAPDGSPSETPVQAVPDMTNDTASILAGFSILNAPTANDTTTHIPTDNDTLDILMTPEENDPWQDYLNLIPLEIMRTRDYYLSSHKDVIIRNICIGGAEAFWPQLSVNCDSLLGMTCSPLTDTANAPTGLPLQQTIALGAGWR